MQRPRRTSIKSSHRLAAPFGTTPTPEGTSFTDRWLSSLAPSLRAGLLMGIVREAARRAADDPFGTLSGEAAELLLGACAEAQGLTVRELRMLVPTIGVECQRRMRSSLRCA